MSCAKKARTTCSALCTALWLSSPKTGKRRKVLWRLHSGALEISNRLCKSKVFFRNLNLPKTGAQLLPKSCRTCSLSCCCKLGSRDAAGQQCRAESSLSPCSTICSPNTAGAADSDGDEVFSSRRCFASHVSVDDDDDAQCAFRGFFVFLFGFLLHGRVQECSVASAGMPCDATRAGLN